MKAEQLRGLYAITDEQLIKPGQFAQNIELALQGGARIIQYRDKNSAREQRLAQAANLKRLCTQYNALLIINDDIDLARTVQADGIHLGEQDSSIAAARELLGDDFLIGQSCYNRFELALQAQAEGANYVAFGAFYSSPTKPQARNADIELLRQAQRRLHIPVCAIGGIHAGNAAELVEAGADMVAVISGLFARDQIKSSAEHISALFR